MRGRRAHRESTRALGEGRTSRTMKKKTTYLNATTSPRSYLRFITMDQRLKSATSRGRDKSGFSVGYAGKGFSAEIMGETNGKHGVWRRGEEFTPPLSPRTGKSGACHGGLDVSTDLHAVARHCTNRMPDLREHD